MKKNNTNLIFTIVIILAVIIFAIFALSKNTTPPDEDTAKCIGENSVVYVQLGCHACAAQEELFGENWTYMNVVDCFYEQDKCGEIQATPTWKINGELYRGVQSIETLKELTSC